MAGEPGGNCFNLKSWAAGKLSGNFFLVQKFLSENAKFLSENAKFLSENAKFGAQNLHLGQIWGQNLNF